jgi:uncharacterized protein YdiU (UPF0061 family)
MGQPAKKFHKLVQLSYSRFDQIDGSHDIKMNIPQAYVEYGARFRDRGHVVAFNFELAKEMGLIAKDHINKMNKDLEQKILDTFGIVIINEYDLQNGIKFDQDKISPNTYMATRYLQLQHPDQVGKNSGDGRSIWNGQFSALGKTWDISSCGTGATRLSPATSIYKKFFQTGDPTISYGCGYSEVDEGLSSLLFSEIFNKNAVATERVLAVLKFKDGFSITVRASQNLLRPSHFFMHIKQGNREALTKLLHHYIQREVRNSKMNKTWRSTKEMYRAFLEYFTANFAKVAARFEDDYIFCWLDWDGDNILMDGGIIDYGSVRQFGLFHYEYRYDDVQRYSTTIIEQKKKVKYMIQTFAQIIDFVLTGKKKPIQKFKRHWTQTMFDRIFEQNKNLNLLTKIGFKPKQCAYLLSHHAPKVEKFRQVFSHFERAKSNKGLVKVSDGVNWNAIFCMRDILRELPQLLLARGSALTPREFVDIMASSYASKKDVQINSSREKKCEIFQKTYLSLINNIVSFSNSSQEQILLELSMRSSIVNRYDRVTGDSITLIVEKLMKSLTHMTPDQLAELIYEFADYQYLNPDKTIHAPREIRPKSKMMYQFLDIVKECREGL